MVENSSEKAKAKEKRRHEKPFFPDDTEIIMGAYKILKRIGYGSFGQVFKGLKKDTGEYVAIKCEKEEIDENGKHKDHSGFLAQEAGIMSALADDTSCPHVHYSGKNKESDGNTYFFLCMDYLGLNLTELMNREVDRKFTPETCLHLTLQFIRQIASTHSKQIVHRDIKPDNWLIGTAEAAKNTVFLVDYGCAAYYTSRWRKEEHIKMNENEGFCGTYMFASLNTHEGKTKSRRDDLEEILYLCVFLWHGTVPWRNLDTEDKVKMEREIYDWKKRIAPEELFKDMPQFYIDFYQYVRGLGFEEEPDYSHWATRLEKAMRDEFDIDPTKVNMDWRVPDPEKELDGLISEMEACLGLLENYQPK